MKNNRIYNLTFLRRKSLKYLVFLFLLGALPSYTMAIATSVPISVQQYSIKLSVNNQPLSQVLKAISKQSGITIAYSSDEIALSSRFSGNIETNNIEQALRIVLGNEYSFRKVNDHILISSRQQKKSSVTKKMQVTGLITDSDGNPIPGATVMISEQTTGVISDLEGRYTIMANKGDILEFRYIGFVTETRTINDNTTINVRMMESAVSVDEVVIVGYGQQKKSSVVSSINTIGPAELNIKSDNLKDGIAGKLPGIIAVQRSGEPGNDSGAFYIRGQSSYAGGTDPLVLIDGIPRNMSDIDVDEIETFSVLKDAAATAVYGAEGANGVVLITTKRGKVQKNQIDVNVQYGIVTPTRMIELMDSYNYLKLWNEVNWNDAGNPTQWTAPISDEVLGYYRDGTDPDLYPSVDWTNLLKNRTHSQRYMISFRGGSERTRYFASGTYYQEDGIYDTNPSEHYNANVGLQRFNLRSNVDMDITKTTQLSIDMSGQYVLQNYPGFSSGDIFKYISSYPVHVTPMYFSDGTWADASDTTTGVEHNPYNMLNNSGYTKQWGAHLQTKAMLNQKLDFITKGLSARGIVSFDADFAAGYKRTKVPATYHATGRDENGNLIKQQIRTGSELSDPVRSAMSGTKRIYIEAALNYARVFGDIHDVTAMLLYNQKETQYQNGEALGILPYRKQNFVARASYAYDRRYVLEASMGMTGSENFASGHRWGIFPAFGFAWNIGEEKFLKESTDIFNKLRLRASFGITGNDAIGNNTRFPYRESMNLNANNGYPLGFSGGAGQSGGTNNKGNGISEGTIAMPYLSWEKERKIDVGIDLGMFNGAIDMTLDYFNNRRTDILLQRRTMLNVTGIRNAPWQNIGIVNNQGIEGSLNLKQKIGEVNLSALGNFTYAKNKIIEYDEVPTAFEYQSITGRSLGKPYVYIAEGLYTPDDFDIIVDPTTGANSYTLKSHLPKPAANVMPGDIKYKDLNKDGSINGDDRTRDNDLYSQTPEIVYGFGLNAEWKGWFVGVFFQGVAHTSTNLMASYGNIMPFLIGFDKGSARTMLNDRWRPEDPYNQNVLFPRMHSSAFVHNTEYASTWWYRDGGFLRLKNVEIGYEFNKKKLSKYKLNNLRVYLQGTNLAVWDHVKYWDPELGNASSGAVYPLERTFSLGLEVTF